MCSDKKIFSKSFYLAAGECNPQGEMPLTLLVSRIIEVATLHANSWGVGFERLIRDNQSWVLTRVTVELTEYPCVNTNYTLTTWIEDYNRHFSQRNMRLDDGQGNTLGYVRTIWMVIDLAERASVDISQLQYIRANVADIDCPIAPQSHLRPVQGGKSVEYTFGYMDCDFNRHVNTVRYLGHLMDLFPMERYDTHMISRMEIAFIKESRYRKTVNFILDDTIPDDNRMTITAPDGSDHVRARFLWKKRKPTDMSR